MVTWFLDRAGCHLACVEFSSIKSQLSAPIHLDIPNIWLEKQVVTHCLVNLLRHFSVSLLACVLAGYILHLHSIFIATVFVSCLSLM